MGTEKHSQAFECARKLLAPSNDTPALYRLPKDSFDFFVGRYLPCLLGSSHNGGVFSWKEMGPKSKRELLSFLPKVEKLGVPCGTFDDIPRIQNDAEYFLLFYALLRLMEEEKSRELVNQTRQSRLLSIETLLAEFPKQIFKGFVKDNDASRTKGQKPPKPSPLNYVRVKQVMTDYYSGKTPASPPHSGHRVLGCFVFLLILAAVGTATYFLTVGGWKPDIPFPWKPSQTEEQTPDSPPGPSVSLPQTTDSTLVEPETDIDEPETDIREPVVQQGTPSGYQGEIEQFYVNGIRSTLINGLKFDCFFKAIGPGSFVRFQLDGGNYLVTRIGESFTADGTEFELVDIETDQSDIIFSYGKDYRSDKEIITSNPNDPLLRNTTVYIQDRHKDFNPIACRFMQPVYYPRIRVELVNPQNGAVIRTSVGSTFELVALWGGKKRYMIRSADPVRKQVVVEPESGFPEKIMLVSTPVDTFRYPETINQGSIDQFYVKSIVFNDISGLKLDHIHEDSDSDSRFAVFKINDSTTKVLDIGDSFKFGDLSLRLVDIEMDGTSQEGIAYLQRVGRHERIACRENQPVRLPENAVLCNDVIGTTILVSAGFSFKLIAPGTGVAEYYLSFVDPDNMRVVVEPNPPGSGKYMLGSSGFDATVIEDGAHPAESAGEKPAEQTRAGNEETLSGADARERAMQETAEKERIAEQQNKNDSGSAGPGSGPGSGETGQSGPRQEAGNNPLTSQEQRELAEKVFLLGLKEIMDRESKIAIGSIVVKPDQISTSGTTVVVPFISSRARTAERRSKLRNDSFKPNITDLFSSSNCKAMKQAVIGGEKSKIFDSAKDDYTNIFSFFIDKSNTDKLAGTLEKIRNGQYTVCRFSVAVVVKSYHEQHTFKSFSGDSMNFTVRSEMKADLEIHDRSTGDDYATELQINGGERTYNVSTSIRYSDFAQEKDWSSADFIKRSVILEDIGKVIHDYLLAHPPEKELARVRQTESATGTGSRPSGSQSQSGPATGTGSRPSGAMTEKELDSLQLAFRQSLKQAMEKQGKIVIGSINAASNPIPATGHGLTMSDQRSGLRQDVRPLTFTPLVPGVTSEHAENDADQDTDLCVVLKKAAIEKTGTGSTGSIRPKASRRVLETADDDFGALSDMYDDEEAVGKLYETTRDIERGYYTICRYYVEITVKSYSEQHVFKEFSVGRMLYTVRSAITIDLSVYDRSRYSLRNIKDVRITTDDKQYSIGTQRDLMDFTSSRSISTENASIDRKLIFEELGEKLNSYLISDTFIQALTR